MKSNYKAIGELVERVDERNRDASITTLIGVSIDKKFIPSVANVIGTDLTNYKVIRKFDFAVSLMQVSRDERIRSCHHVPRISNFQSKRYGDYLA